MSQHDDRRFGSRSIEHPGASSERAPAPEQRTSLLPPPPRSASDAVAARPAAQAIDLTQVAILLEVLDGLPREIAERHLLLPISIEGERMHVAMANPNDGRAIDEISFVTGKQIVPYVAPARLLARVLDAAYEAKSRGARHYIGPNCPPHALPRAGLATPAPPGPPQRASLPPPSLPPPSLPPALRPRTSMVVEGRGPSRGLTSELTDDGFGMLSADLSSVTDLNVLGRLAQGHHGSIPPDVATILVVDDDAENRRMLTRFFSEKGYRVIEADRGLTALRLVKEQTPSLIVLDAMLPELHGFDIAKRIKGSRKYGHIPIVMMSAVHRGWRYAEDVKASCGVSEYVEKPFRIAEMMEAVDRALSAAPPNEGEGEEEALASADAEQALADGIAAYHAGDLEAAIAHLKRGVGIDPLAYRLHFHLGLLLGKRGVLYEAIQALETAIGINPRHFPALKNLAVLYQKAGFRNKAIETWERSLSAAPDEVTRQSIKEHLVGLL